MSNFEKIRYYYNRKLYKTKHLLVFLEKGVITEEEYNEIVGG